MSATVKHVSIPIRETKKGGKYGTEIIFLLMAKSAINFRDFLHYWKHMHGLLTCKHVISPYMISSERGHRNLITGMTLKNHSRYFNADFHNVADVKCNKSSVSSFCLFFRVAHALELLATY